MGPVEKDIVPVFLEAQEASVGRLKGKSIVVDAKKSSKEGKGTK